MKSAWQTRFREAKCRSKGTTRSGDADEFPVRHKDDGSADKSSRMKDAIFGHKLAYRVKKKITKTQNQIEGKAGVWGGGEMNSLHPHE